MAGKAMISLGVRQNHTVTCSKQILRSLRKLKKVDALRKIDQHVTATVDRTAKACVQIRSKARRKSPRQKAEIENIIHRKLNT